MVNSRTDQLDETFFALSDPKRRLMLSWLARGEASVSELSQPLDISAPAVSKHLRVLERAGLVVQRHEGRRRICSLQAQPLKKASAYVEKYRKFWENQLDSLAEYLDSQTEAQPPQDS